MGIFMRVLGAFLSWYTFFSASLLFAQEYSHTTIPTGIVLQAGLVPDVVARGSLFLGVLLLWTIAWGKIFKYIFKIPVIAGQIIGGILLGPSLCNIAQWSVFAHQINLMHPETWEVFSFSMADLFSFFIFMLSSAFTVSYLLWIAGHETDLRDIAKVGLTAVTAGVLGALMPIVCMMIFCFIGMCTGWSMVQATGFGLIMSATSVSIPVAMLFSYNKMHLKSSKVTLGAAVIDDIFAVILVSLFFIAVSSGIFGADHCVVLPDHCQTLHVALGYMATGFIIMLLGGYYGIPRLLSWLKYKKLSHLIAPIAQSIMFFYFAFAELFGGLAGITGSYFAGLFHRMGDERHAAEKVFSPYVNRILLPLFLGSIGLQINVGLLRASDWLQVGLLLLIAIASKLVGCYLAAGLSNMVNKEKSAQWSSLETFLFGSSMVARGEVGLVIATLLFGANAITIEQYVIAIVVIVLSTVAAPIMLSFGFSRLALQERAMQGKESYRLNIGRFSIIGTTQLFHMLVGQLENTGHYNTSIQMSDGRKIVNIEEDQVKIILSPSEGIIFEGDRGMIEQIVKVAKEAIDEEFSRLSL